MTTGQPMREPTFHVLAAMLDGPLHGYGIIPRAHELTDGRVRLAAAPQFWTNGLVGSTWEVVPGRKPCLKLLPPFVEVAHPMSEATPGPAGLSSGRGDR